VRPSSGEDTSPAEILTLDSMKITRFFKRAFAAVWKNLVLWGIQLRVAHWGKNFLVFFPMLYCGRGGDFGTFIRVCGLFAAFCLLSSAMYLVNDLVDLPCDCLHPRKKFRPLASGKIGKRGVRTLAVVLSAAAAGAAFFLGPSVQAVFCVYLLNTFAYIFFFRKTAVIDILAIAAGFLLRLTAGAAVVNCRVSPVFFICVFIFCLFFTLAKRRAEAGLLEEHSADPASVRKVFAVYNSKNLDKILPAAAGICVLAYSLPILFFFTLYPGVSAYLLLGTIPPVLYCFFRYTQIVTSGDNSGLFRVVISHKGILGAAMLWAFISCLVISAQCFQWSPSG